MPWDLEPNWVESGWVLQPALADSGLDWLVNVLRRTIADPTSTINRVIKESLGVTSSGVANETFYTHNLPIASGYATYLYIGRWLYTEVTATGDADGLRSYVFNVESGAYWIPEGAILGVSGEQVYATYSWEEQQTYNYTDNELKLYLQDAVSEINNGYYDFGFRTTGVSDSFDVSPNLTVHDVGGYVYAKYAAYLIKKRQEAEGFDNRIYVRDLNVTIDTAKGLGDLSKSANQILNEIKDICQTLRVEGQEAAFARIDTYSTWRSQGLGNEQYQQRWNTDSEYYRN